MKSDDSALSVLTRQQSETWLESLIEHEVCKHFNPISLKEGFESTLAPTSIHCSQIEFSCLNGHWGNTKNFLHMYLTYVNYHVLLQYIFPPLRLYKRPCQIWTFKAIAIHYVVTLVEEQSEKFVLQFQCWVVPIWYLWMNLLGKSTYILNLKL